MATAIRDELTFLSFPITKWDKTDDGDLIVVGKATDGSVDSDEQIVDPAWSAKALTDWLDSGGNVRVQHQAMRDPAGKGLSVEIDKDGDGGHWVKSLVVEPVAKRLVEKGVLTSYSVGIARPVVMRDPSGKARGGIVTGGHLAELSLVDRPANKNCQLVIAKAAGDSVELVGELVGDPDWIAKIADEEDLLVKASSNGSGPAADDASQAASDSGDADDDNDSDDDDDDGDDDNDDDAASKTEEPGAADLIAAADNETRAAYKAARTQWLSCEPTVKGIAHGTEYLAKRADWMRWQAEGDAEGLAGTREGAERWLAKRADDDLLAKAEAADAAETALLKTLDVADKRFFSAERRRQLAHQGNSLPDGSYPIPDADALRRAAVLARSGHGNVAAARRLISRRAKELGVPNPLKESDAVKKTDGESSSSSDGKPCGTCHGDGKIMGNNRTCPDCNGTGKMTAKTDTPALAADADAAEASPDSKTARKAAKTARREAALAALADTVTKTVEAGLITREAADEIIATAAAESAVKAKKKRQLPADVAPARPHREPDGTSTVEDFEPDAGLPTDPDRTPDKIPVSVSSHDHTGPPPAGKPRTKTDDSAPYRIGRLHDLTCAAYDPAETLAGYPSLKSFSDAVDVAWFADQAAAVAAAGKAAEAAYLAGLVADAQYVKDADPAAIADGLGLLRKAFTDMYPTLNITPQSGIRPGSYQRPYLTAGHAAETAERNGSANIPPSSKVPEPEQFHRPLITDGHEADSPANKEDNFPIPPRTGAVRTYYTNQQRDNAKAALQAMHDHIAGSFPDLCPMAASKSVIPPDLGAANVPQPVTVTSQGGIPAAGKTTEPDVMSLAEMQGVIADAIRRHNARGGMPVTVKPVMTRKRIEKAAARLGLDIVERHAPPAETTAVPVQPGLTAAELKALLTEQFTPLVEAHETQITELRKQIDEIGSRPDPAMAPVRGALARMPAETAVPVERRSLIDEHADHVRKMAEAEQAQYRAYVEALAKSPDPGVREAALATLDKMLTPTQTAPGI